MKDVFKNRTAGMRALLVCICLSLVTACVYAGVYASTRYISWKGFIIMIAGAVLAFVLMLAKLQRFAPALLLVTNFAALLFHVYYIYFFISSVVTGIQFSGFPASFFVVFILFGLTLILSIACVFLPVEEKEDKAHEA